ncbi:MAG: hypothetical protein ACOCRO_10060 [Halanaerobiales bacterium]
MTNERNKVSKILSELVSYYFSNNVTDIDINVNYSSLGLKIKLSGKSDSEPKELDKLNEILKSSRQTELEEYYWGLLGTNNSKQELYLLGSLVDDGEVKYENGILKMSISRKFS